jgi:hypothetical protein
MPKAVELRSNTEAEKASAVFVFEKLIVSPFRIVRMN